MKTQDNHSPMQGFRVLELSRCEGQATLAAVTGAVLADWGADVVKINHGLDVEAHDRLREHMEGTVGEGAYDVLMDHANRGKRSVGVAIESAKGLEVLKALIRTSDVFITNFTAADRQRLGFDVEQVRALNPDIIYARATSAGVRGPEADRGGPDLVVWWN